MVTDPAEYRRSSFLYHGSGKDDPLQGPFPEWEQLERPMRNVGGGGGPKPPPCEVKRI